MCLSVCVFVLFWGGGGGYTETNTNIEERGEINK